MCVLFCVSLLFITYIWIQQFARQICFKILYLWGKKNVIILFIMNVYIQYHIHYFNCHSGQCLSFRTTSGCSFPALQLIQPVSPIHVCLVVTGLVVLGILEIASFWAPHAPDSAFPHIVCHTLPSIWLVCSLRCPPASSWLHLSPVVHVWSCILISNIQSMPSSCIFLCLGSTSPCISAFDLLPNISVSRIRVRHLPPGTPSFLAGVLLVIHLRSFTLISLRSTPGLPVHYYLFFF